MKKKNLSFIPLKDSEQKLAGEYAVELNYKVILDNDARKNLIITEQNKVFLLIVKGKTLYAVRKGLEIPITKEKLDELKFFRRGFKHINIHDNVIRLIFGFFAFSNI